MVVNRAVPLRPATQHDVVDGGLQAATAAAARDITDIQQLTREVFADVKDIENFYSIKSSRKRVSLASTKIQRVA